MKILHVCANYYPAFGGPQYTMKHLSEKLIEYYKDDVEVVTTDSLYGPELNLYEKINIPEETINGVKIKRFPFRTWHYKIIGLSSRAYKRLLKKPLPHAVRKYRWELDCKGIDNTMRINDCDVIMASTVNYMFCDYPLWRFKTKDPKPFVLYGSLHLEVDWSNYQAIINRAKICDCYIANTEYERKKLIEFGVQKEKIVTVGTGIDVADLACNEASVQAFRNKNHIQDDDILIGHIGRLSEGKGAGLLLDAFIQLYQKNKKCKLLLAGTATDYTETLKQKVEQHKIPVIIFENFENQLKPMLFNAIDIFVLASGGESFGVVFLEAWACKKPIVATNMGATASLLSEGKDSLLFAVTDIDELVCKIEMLVNDVALQRTLGINGYNKVIENFSWPLIVKKYREAYLKGIENFKTEYSNRVSA